jgi:hypothetical protein
MPQPFINAIALRMGKEAKGKKKPQCVTKKSFVVTKSKWHSLLLS